LMREFFIRISLRDFFVSLRVIAVTLRDNFLTLGDIFVNHILRLAKYHINVS